MTFRRKDKGGISLSQTFKGEPKFLDQQVVKTILAEYRIANADVILHEDCTGDQLIDVIEGNRVYMPCVYVLNKLDAISLEELEVRVVLPRSLASPARGAHCKGPAAADLGPVPSLLPDFGPPEVEPGRLAG